MTDPSFVSTVHVHRRRDAVTEVLVAVVFSPAVGALLGVGWRAFRWAAGW